MSTPVTQDQALTAFARPFTYARAQRDERAATGGAEAVGRAAEPNGTEKQQAAIAAHYQRLQHEAGGMTAA